MHTSSPVSIPLYPVSFDSNSEYPLDTTPLYRPATLGVAFLSSQSLPSFPSSHLVSFCYFPSCICVRRDSVYIYVIYYIILANISDLAQQRERKPDSRL